MYQLARHVPTISTKFDRNPDIEIQKKIIQIKKNATKEEEKEEEEDVGKEEEERPNQQTKDSEQEQLYYQLTAIRIILVL